MKWVKRAHDAYHRARAYALAAMATYYGAFSPFEDIEGPPPRTRPANELWIPPVLSPPVYLALNTPFEQSSITAPRVEYDQPRPCARRDHDKRRSDHIGPAPLVFAETGLIPVSVRQEVPMGHHINSAGEFQSDRYPDLGPDKVVVSFRHPQARRALHILSVDYMPRDQEFAADVRTRLDALHDGFDDNTRAYLERLEVARLHREIAFIAKDYPPAYDIISGGFDSLNLEVTTAALGRVRAAAGQVIGDHADSGAEMSRETVLSVPITVEDWNTLREALQWLTGTEDS